MKQNLNKEQLLQEIQVLTDTINKLIWIDSDDSKYQNLLGKVIDAKSDLYRYVLRNMVSEPTLENKLEQLHEYLDTGSYEDITYLIVRLLEQIVRQISKEK